MAKYFWWRWRGCPFWNRHHRLVGQQDIPVAFENGDKPDCLRRQFRLCVLRQDDHHSLWLFQSRPYHVLFPPVHEERLASCIKYCRVSRGAIGDELILW